MIGDRPHPDPWPHPQPAHGQDPHHGLGHDRVGSHDSGEGHQAAHDPDAPLLLACRALARAIDVFEEAACQVLAVGRSDLRALNLLEHGPLSPAVIAEKLRLSRSSVTTLLDRLERAGYVTRSADPADRRGVQVALRPETFRAFARVYLPLGRRVHDSVEGLSHDDRSALLTGLGVLTQAFQEASGSASTGASTSASTSASRSASGSV